MSADTRLDERTTLRMDAALKLLVRRCAKAEGKTLNDFMVDAITEVCRRRLATQIDTELAPVVGQKLDDVLRPRLQSLRDYLGRLHAEQHRTQYLLYYLMRLLTEDEMPPTIENAIWEKGWEWAVTRLQQRPKLPRDPADGPPR